MNDEAEAPRSEVSGISLRLGHPQPRDLGQILRNWGYHVGREWQAGEPRRTPKGNPLEGIWPDSYAYAKLDVPSGRLSDMLARIVDSLQATKPELQAFASEGGRAELFVHWHFNSNSGDTLDWTLLQKLSECRLNLALDIYPDGDWLEGVDLDPADDKRQRPGRNGEGRSNGEA